MKETRPSTQQASMYDNPDLIRKVVELRSSSGDKTYDMIAEDLKVEYPNISRQKVAELFKKGVARSITIEKRAGKKFDDFSAELNKMYQRAVKLMGSYLSALEHVNTKLEELGDDGLDSLSARKQIVKMLPEATKLWKELREYMKFHIDQQEKITETRDAEVWTYQEYVDKTKETLDLLEDEGYTIIKPEI